MALSVTRRAWMMGSTGAALALAAGLSPGPAAALEAIDLDAFRRLSARLTGAVLSDLDAQSAATILDGLLSLGRGADLARLATDATASSGSLANDVVAAWYSGIANSDRGEVLAAFTGALVWNALDYTKPFASCGGETGYWAEPPQD